MSDTHMGAVVVTGASSGIGEACARWLANAGFVVFAGARKDKDLDAIRERGEKRLQALKIDVANSLSIAAAVKDVDQRLDGKPLVGLVNNAGIAVGGPQEYLEMSEWRRQFDVNVFGLIETTKAFMPLLRKGTGRIVNISSIGGKVASPFLAPYSASKFAVEAITDALRLELQRWNMHAVLVEPGAVKTPIWDKGEEELERLKGQFPKEALTLYAPEIQRLAKFTNESRDRGVPPQQVAEAVEHALTATRPRTRYPVGTDAKMGTFLRWLLPDRAMDWMMLKFG